MIQGAALLRAQLGVALRGCPSELRCFSPDSHPRASRIDVAVGQLARELECAAPGIALMLQLRARFFDAAVRGAWRRGIRQLATIGVGFDDGRLRTFARRGGLVLDVDEHAVILAKASHHGGVQHLPVVALDRGLATAMARLDALRAHAPTFFLVQNASLWTTADTLRHLLAPCRSAVAGSELLLNVFARDGGRGAPDEPARFGVATPASAAASSDAIFTTLMRQVDELRLQVRARLDSGALQRRYVGFDDLLVRESYLWLRTPGRTERDGRKASVLAMLAPPAARVRRTSAVLRATDRPQLRPDLVLRPSPSGNMMIARSVTPLRTVGVCATPTEIAAALLLDGSRSLEDVTDAVVGEDRSVDPANVIRGVERLHVAGLLVDDAEAIAPIREVTSLRTLATSAMDALRRRDRGDDRRVEVRKVLDALGPFQANPVLRHLRTLVVQRLRGTLWATVIGNGSMHVLLGDDASPAWGREVLADAIALLARIGATLGLAPSVTVLIDVTPSRRGIPLTWVETAEPYTLIRIPRPSWPTSSPTSLQRDARLGWPRGLRCGCSGALRPVTAIPTTSRPTAMRRTRMAPSPGRSHDI